MANQKPKKNFRIRRLDGEEDGMTHQIFKSFDDAEMTLRQIADNSVGAKPLGQRLDDYKILESDNIKEQEVSCPHCHRTKSNGLKCLGMCVADNEY